MAERRGGIGWRHAWALGKRRVGEQLRRHHWRAAIRALVLSLRLHDGESCQRCGRDYPFIWWAPQPLWDRCSGLGMCGRGPRRYGLLCPICLDELARMCGYRLSWTPMVVEDDGVPTTNWWLDETRDALMMGEPDPGYFPHGQVRQPQPTWARLKPLIAPDLPSPYPPANLAAPAAPPEGTPDV